MKNSMETPNILYLSDFTDTSEPVFYIKTFSQRQADVKYIRADVFIEKAEDYLRQHFDCSSNWGYVASDDYASMKDFIEDFKTYMKGE